MNIVKVVCLRAKLYLKINHGSFLIVSFVPSKLEDSAQCHLTPGFSAGPQQGQDSVRAEAAQQGSGRKWELKQSLPVKPVGHGSGVDGFIHPAPSRVFADVLGVKPFSGHLPSHSQQLWLCVPGHAELQSKTA